MRYQDVYRINTHFDVPRYGNDKIATVSPPIASVAKIEIPEIEVAARIFPQVTNLIRYEDKMFYEDGGKISDSTIFDVLTYTFTEGSPRKALTDPNTIVITDKLAKKIFGGQPALNKIISITQDSAAINFKVTGVVKDNPKSHFRPAYFIALSSDGSAFVMRSEGLNNEWAGIQFVTAYVKLRAGVTWPKQCLIPL
ncbi:MAG TPA: ABC transporter permease [Chryseolinea sp.]